MPPTPQDLPTADRNDDQFETIVEALMGRDFPSKRSEQMPAFAYGLRSGPDAEARQLVALGISTLIEENVSREAVDFAKLKRMASHLRLVWHGSERPDPNFGSPMYKEATKGRVTKGDMQMYGGTAVSFDEFFGHPGEAAVSIEKPSFGELVIQGDVHLHEVIKTDAGSDLNGPYEVWIQMKGRVVEPGKASRTSPPEDH